MPVCIAEYMRRFKILNQELSESKAEGIAESHDLVLLNGVLYVRNLNTRASAIRMSVVADATTQRLPRRMRKMDVIHRQRTNKAMGTTLSRDSSVMLTRDDTVRSIHPMSPVSEPQAKAMVTCQCFVLQRML